MLNKIKNHFTSLLVLMFITASTNVLADNYVGKYSKGYKNVSIEKVPHGYYLKIENIIDDTNFCYYGDFANESPHESYELVSFSISQSNSPDRDEVTDDICQIELKIKHEVLLWLRTYGACEFKCQGAAKFELENAPKL